MAKAKVNIYLRDDTLAFAKAAAAQAKLSLSAWFAQLARARVKKDQADWGSLFAKVDALRQPGEDDGLDFLLEARPSGDDNQTPPATP